MRVMPPKEARSSHAIFRAWLFVLMRDKLNQETRKSGKESDGGTRSVASQDRQHVDLRVPSFVMSSEVETSLTISLII
jgi:hypothetical protein